MENDHYKKRSRTAESGSSAGGLPKKERETPAPPVATSVTEEEFNEFIAIVRRMQEAVKYFGKRSGGVEGGRELQTEESPERGVDDDEVNGKKTENVVVVDLNTVPEGENNSFSY